MKVFHDSLLVSEYEHHVAFRMNRVEKRNALNTDLVRALTQALIHYGSQPHIRLIVITGQGSVFSAGADLESIKALQTASIEENVADSTLLAALFRAMNECPVPLLGAANGHALAGGCGLLTLCDITVSVPHATFGYTETRIGFVPALVTKFLISKVGLTHAQRLLLSAEIITSDEAARIGLISEVAEHFDDRVDYWIQVFTQLVSPSAVRTTRALIREVQSMNLEQSIDYALVLNAHARMTPDCQKGIAAFLNKETIRW